MVTSPGTTPDLFFTGGGVLYPPHVLHSDVLDSELFMRLAPTNDDIWFNIMAKRAFTQIYCTGRSVEITKNLIPNTQEESLWASNKFKNDTMLNNIITHFGHTFDYIEVI